MAVGEDRCSTGSVGVQYAFDPEWNQKNAAQLQYQLQQYLLRSAQAMYVPSLVWKEDSVSSGPGEWISQKALAWIPVVQYVEDHAEYGSSLEDEETIAKILESQANDENAVDEMEN